MRSWSNLYQKKLKLTARKILKCKVVSEKVTRYEAAQQAATARSQSRVQYYKGLRYRGHKRNKANSSGSRGERGGLGEPEMKCKRIE